MAELNGATVHFGSWAGANRVVLARQHLCSGTRSADLVRVVADAAGLHATSRTSPYLSLFARVQDFRKADLDQALYSDRRLVRMRCMRKTIFIHTREFLPVAFAATAAGTTRASRRYMEAQGISADDYRRLESQVMEILEGRSLTAAGIRAAIGARAGLSAALYLMCDEAKLVRGRPDGGWRDARHRYARFEEWFPTIALGRMNQSEATSALVRRYVAAYGPVSERDIAWWTGVGKTRVRRALTAIQDDLVEVSVAGEEGTYRMISSVLGVEGAPETPPGTVVNLLPVLDPYLMAYKDRSRYIDEEHREWAFDRSGNVTSVVLIDGRIAGVWDFGLAGGASGDPAVRLHFLRPVTDQEREQTHREGAAVGRFIADATVRVSECDHMIPLVARTAGSMMSPLGPF